MVCSRQHRIAHHLPGLLSWAALVTASACTDSSGPQNGEPPADPQFYTYAIVDTFPHDRTSFTQGLVFQDGDFIESTGRRDQSKLRRVAIETGEVLKEHRLARDYFGEGATVLGNRVYQLTWTSRIAFVYDLETFAALDTLNYETQGWGLTHDDTHLIMSDGTATITFRDPVTFSTVRSLTVRDDTLSISRLNELEYIDGEIYANIWTTDRIVRISPIDGKVTGWINLAGLLDLPPGQPSVDVLNGIAFDPIDRRLFVTGKLWPYIFEIELVPAGQ